MDYGDLLKRTWHYLWRYPILWLFGILQGCQTFNFNSDLNNAASQQALAMLKRWASDPIVILALAVFVLSMLLLLLVSQILGMIGTSRTTLLAEEGKGQISLALIFADGWRAFWRLLGVQFLWGTLLFFLLIVLFVIPLVTFVLNFPSEDMVGVFVAALALLCLFLPVAFLLTPLIRMSYIAMVLEKVGFWKSFLQGWRVYVRNFWRLLLFSLILVFLRIGIIFPVALLLSLLPLSPLFYLAFILPFGLVLFGGVNAFTQSAFTLAYLRLRPSSEEAFGASLHLPPPPVSDVLEA
ncbi:MAG: hypothetical protein ACK4VW_00630 [Anaerolineales bacterium]